MRITSKRLPIIVLGVTALLAVLIRDRLIAGRQTASPDSRPHSIPSQRNVDPETSCGPVSLAVVSHFLQRPVSIAAFHQATQAGEMGVCSFTDLRQALHLHGFASAALRCDPKHPPNLTLPMILFVEDTHFVVALPGGSKGPIIVDPPATTRQVRWDELAARWRGEALVIAVDEADLVKVTRTLQ